MLNANTKHLLYCLGFILMVSSCTHMSYWKNIEYDSPYGNTPIEIQVSDSTFAYYQYNNQSDMPSNTGSGTIQKAKIIKDTILVYEYLGTWVSEDSFYYEQKIEYAYINKSRKLYMISPSYPLSAWQNLFSTKSKDSTWIDSSKVVRFKPSWEGWSSEYAYINYGDSDYYKKGKNKRMRKSLKEKLKEEDFTEWFMTYGKTLTSDTTYIRRYEQDSLGPFQVRIYLNK